MAYSKTAFRSTGGLSPLRRVLHALLGPPAPGTPHPTSPSHPFARRIHLEPLEDRRMLSTLFVDADATPGGDGLSWATAFDDLQTGLEAAETANRDGDAGNDVEAIWIAEGTYRPSKELDSGSWSFSLLENVTLYGGFAGTETSLDARNGTIHGTILSGDLGVPNDISDNTFTVVYCGKNVESALDGISIIGGNAHGRYSSTYPDRDNGGGIYNDGTLTLTNCAIAGNRADEHGGGVYSCRDATLRVANTVFLGNSASDGGALYSYASVVEIVNSTLTENSAERGGTGGISHPGDLTVSNSILWRNTAGELRGGAYPSICRNLIGIDPGFVRNPDPGPDDEWGTEDDNYGDLRLTECSPAIDYGREDLLASDALDLDADGNTIEPIPFDRDGNSRIYGGEVDCGAFEFQVEMAPGRETPALEVTTAEDVFDLYDNEVSLREAIWYADPETSNSTITFETSLNSATITLLGQSLYVTKPVTIDASALESLTIDAAGGSRVLTIIASEPGVELNGLTITGGFAEHGGGVYNSRSGTLTITDTIVKANSASGLGGGLYNCYGSITITDSTFTGNDASSGGGIYDAAGLLIVENSAIVSNSVPYGNGGGIYSSGNMSVTNSIVVENSAYCGGGIYSWLTLTLTNSTIARNSALSGGGGGICSRNTLNISNSTISGNGTMTGSGGGIYSPGYAEALLNNTIVAGNWAYSEPDIRIDSDTVSGANNLIGIGSGQSALVHGENGNQVGTSELPIDPLLSEWVQFENGLGGYYPLSGSPALDMGDNALALDTNGLPLVEDITGNPRIVGTTVDLGAVEGATSGRPAQTYLITSLERSFLEDGDLTFFEALEAANSNQAVGDAPAGSHTEPDTIQFADGLSGTILVDDGELAILGNLNMEGPGDDLLTFDANGQNRVFFVRSNRTVTLSGLTVTGGSADYGGGIYLAVFAELALVDSTISGNIATDSGGGVYARSATLTISDSAFVENSVTTQGIGVESQGGGLCVSGTVTVSNSIFSGNMATAQDSDGYGGGIYSSGTLIITNSVFSENAAMSGKSFQHPRGGGIYIDNGTLTVTGCTFSENMADGTISKVRGWGGGIYSETAAVSVTRSTFSENSATEFGGGIFSELGTVTLSGALFSDNSGDSAGGGIYSKGNVVVINSTLALNSTSYGGGAIYSRSAEVTIANSILFGNASSYGGGIYTDGLLAITNSTISENRAATGGGVYGTGDAFDATLHNTIVAENSATSGPDIYHGSGALSGSHNLVGDGSDQTGLVDGHDANLVGTAESPVDPLLSPWSQFENGAWGQYLLSGSPAIDAASDAAALGPDGQPLEQDWAGNPRIVGSTVDIGAIEGATADRSPQTYLVTSLEQTIAEDGVLTFVEAFQAANGNRSIGDAPAGSFCEMDSIQFAEGVNGTVRVDDGELRIFGDLSIEGPGTAFLTFDAAEQNRVFHIQPNVAVALSGMTVIGGSADNGGAIYSGGSLILTDSAFSDNSSTGAGGAIYSGGGELTIVQSTFSDNTADGAGGAVYCGKDLLVTQSAFSDNKANGGGGGIYCMSMLTLTDTSVSGNSGTRGGGVYTGGPLSISNSTISGNQAESGGGVLGGGTVTIANSTLSNNSATTTGGAYAGPYVGGGGIFASDTLIVADSILQGNSAWRHGGGVCSTGTLTITNCMLAGNSARYGSGGGIYTKDAGPVTVTNSTLVENSATDLSGGAICCAGSETVTIADSTFSRNWVTAYSTGRAAQGGAIYNASGTMTVANCMISDNSATPSESASGARGGAIYNYSGSLNVTNSTLSGNVAQGGGIGTQSRGGGIYVYSGVVTIVNSTLSGNSADREGGAIQNDSGKIKVTNSTISGNSAQYQGGGICSRESNSTTVLNNTIVARNHAPTGPDLYRNSGKLLGSHSLIGDGTDQSDLRDGENGNQVGTALAPIEALLSDWTQFENGLWGYYLLPGSPALDAGNDVLARDPEGTALAWDICGNPRISGVAVDLGATEGAVAVPTAQTYLVTSLETTIAEDGILTFFEAFEAANRNCPVGDAPAGSFKETDTIQFSEGLSGTVLVDHGELVIVGGLTIEGPGSQLFTFNGEGNNRIFRIRSNTNVALGGMTVTGGLADSGGGIYVAPGGMLTITDSTIRKNSATRSGGGIGSLGTLTLVNCSIAENTAVSTGGYGEPAEGGGIYSGSGVLVLSDCTMTQNVTSTTGIGPLHAYGGAVYSDDSSLIVVNSTVVGNSGGYGGGAIYGTGTLTLTNSTIAANTAYVGGGVAFSGSRTISNSILWGNAGGNINGGISAGDRNLIGIDPRFVRNPDQGPDGTWGTEDDDCGDVRLTAQSPAIDFGRNDLLPFDEFDLDSDGNAAEPIPWDLDGNERIYGSAVDCGAFELQEGIAPRREAPSLNVTTAADSFDLYDGEVSLREAAWYVDPEMSDATITFDAALDGATITLCGESLWIDNSVTIDASALDSLTIDAAGKSSVFTVVGSGTEVEFTNLTVVEGRGGGIHCSPGTSVWIVQCTLSNNSGGAVYGGESATLTVTDCTLSQNSAYRGGGIYGAGLNTISLANCEFSGNSATMEGGAIQANAGTILVSDCTFSGNSAADGGAIFVDSGALTVTDTTFSKNSVAGRESYGGAIYCSGTLAVTDSILSENSAGTSGGGIYAASGTTTIAGSTLSDNSAASYGGAISSHSEIMAISDTTILGNSARTGGGVSSSGTVTITRCTILRNRAEETSNGNRARGGGISCSGLVTVKDSLFSENTATGSESNGGAIYAAGTLTLANCRFTKNLTTGRNSDGGAIFNSETLVFMNCTFLWNSASGDISDGGGIYSRGMLAFANSTFARNVATGSYSEGGGICSTGTLIAANSTFSNNAATRRGGGISVSGGLATITNSTVSGNSAGSDGGGLYLLCSTELQNTIVAGNTAPSGTDIFQYSGNITGSHNLISNGAGQTALVNGQNGNLVGTAESPIDPRFVRDPSDGGDGWGDDPDTPDVDESLNDDYGDLRLRADSPAVDAGSNELLPADEFDLDGDGDTSQPLPFDFDGNPRIQNGTVDMGAYEYVAPVLVPGDLNGDEVVGSGDLDIVRANWGRSVAAGSLLEGDPSGDGLVGGADLDIVRANWGRTAPPAAAGVDVVWSEVTDAAEDVPRGEPVYGPRRRDEARAETVTAYPRERWDIWTAALKAWEREWKGRRGKG